jgi:hypothetical protein
MILPPIDCPMFDVFRRLIGSFLGSISEPSVAAAQTVREIHGQFLRAYKRTLMQGAAGKDARVARRRYARDKTQKLAKLMRRGAASQRLPKSVLLVRFRPSPILDALIPEREKNWIPVMKRDRNAESPVVNLEKFSLIEYPRETLKAIKLLGEISSHSVDAQLNFKDDYCIDISPYLVLAEVWPAMANVFRGGQINGPLQKVIEAVRLRTPLSMHFPATISAPDVWAFPLHRRRPSKISKSIDRNLAPQTREKVADGFCGALDDWLGITANLELNDDGKARFASLIGELLDNAERHSELTKDGSWSIVAFMARRVEAGVSVFRCYMAFLSEGISIAESLQTAATTVRGDVDEYCDLHHRKGQSKNTLATLMALQDTITRDAAATAGSRGGIGFQDVLEFVNTFGVPAAPDRAPRLTIVSGGSCIQLRPPYMSGNRSSPMEPRVLWCNPENSSGQPPDPDFVYDLEDHFAGTIVGLTFVLDSDHLRKSIDA